MSESSSHQSQPKFFRLDLGANGGVLEPDTLQELEAWILKEIGFWHWTNRATFQGNLRALIDNAISPLHQSLPHARAAQTHGDNQAAIDHNLNDIQRLLRGAYLEGGLPHSSSVLGRRVETIAARDANEAQAYLYAFLPNAGHPFDAQSGPSWKGFLQGMFEKYGFATVPDEAFEAVQKRTEDLHAEMERFLAGKKVDYENLEERFEQIGADIREREEAQRRDINVMMEEIDASHKAALGEHTEKMRNLEDAFREKMSLRAPVEYWTGRQSHHKQRTKITGGLSFGAIAVLAVILAFISHWVLSNLGADGKPEVWRVSVLILMGVLGIWAIRLIVRIFLSHMHLQSDAAERVTMVKTYLSLVESGSTLSEADRTLVLQALFRPASDGIIKDEGLPHPLLDVLTRAGTK